MYRVNTCPVFLIFQIFSPPRTDLELSEIHDLKACEARPSFQYIFLDAKCERLHISGEKW